MMNEALTFLVDNVLITAALLLWAKSLVELAACRLRYEYRRRY